MKKITNDDIARLLRNVAASYSIKNEKKYRFQILAYQKAADSIESLTTQIYDLVNEDRLTGIDGVGESMKNHLTELIKTGEVTHFNTVTKGVPKSFFVLLDIPTFGPKKAYKLVSHFKLNDKDTVIEDILKLAKEGKIAPLQTFGEKSEKDIIRAIEEYKLGKTKSTRMVLPTAFEISETMLSYLNRSKDVKKAYTLGSLRRMKPTIGDVDIAVTSDNPNAVIEHFIKYPYKDRVIEKGEITASLILNGNKQVDLMVLPPKHLGSMLQHFTGSKEHNIRLREFSLKKGLSLSEKGIKNKAGKLFTFNTEKEFYGYLGLEYIEPELREDRGEIERAKQKKLPKLVKLQDIKGDFHIHSSYPIEPSHDLGQNTMQEMINKANELNYKYLGFSEHNPSIMNHTLEQIYSILLKRNRYIEQIIKSNKSIRIINLLETDILANGNLAIDEKCLKLLDITIVSIHSSFRMEKKKMTERIIKGLSHPKAKILAHPSGRLLNSRAPYEVDWDKLFEFMAKNNKALEINAWPTRLDLDDVLIYKAKGFNLKFVINSDSHAAFHMDNMKYGVAMARRGWCETKDIVNTWPFEKLNAWIKS